MSLQKDLDTLRDGISDFAKFILAEPEMPPPGKKESAKEAEARIEAHRANVREHAARANEWSRTNAVPLIEAGFRVAASLFMNLEVIADAQRQIAFPKTPEPRK